MIWPMTQAKEHAPGDKGVNFFIDSLVVWRSFQLAKPDLNRKIMQKNVNRYKNTDSYPAPAVKQMMTITISCVV